jgi:mycothiol synthase
MSSRITIRNYCPDDLRALVTLINEADAVDKLERATTLQQMEHEMSFPTAHPETDCFLAWEDERLVGFTDLYVRDGDAQSDGVVYCWGVVHPERRRRGVGRQLLEEAYGRACQYAEGMQARQVHFHCNTRDIEADRRALYTGFGMERVRFFVNLARPLNGNVPPVEVPEGVRLRIFDPEQDAETVWRVDNTAFRDHWGHTEGKLEEFLHWIKRPHMRPGLWLLAEVEASGEVVGIALNIIDPDWIAQTGRQEGEVDTLAVLREHRKKGLGRALLVQSLHVLHNEGMEAVQLYADADNLTGAMRLYESVGFRVRKTNMAFRKTMRSK